MENDGRDVLAEEHEPGLFPNPDDSLNTGLYKAVPLLAKSWRKRAIERRVRKRRIMERRRI